MRAAIWKYQLAVDDVQHFSAPRNAKPLSVQMQRGVPTLWMHVDPNEPLEIATVSTYGTGHQMPPNPGEYVGTYQTLDGSLVFHVFYGEPA